jgi:nitric oxide reductase activation protein
MGTLQCDEEQQRRDTKRERFKSVLTYALRMDVDEAAAKGKDWEKMSNDAGSKLTDDVKVNGRMFLNAFALDLI